MCDMESFCKTLEEHVAILAATVTQKQKLHQLLDGTHEVFGSNIRLVEINNWAGLGGVRYVPEDWAEQISQLTSVGKDYINQLNSQLVTKLRTSDSAFSLGGFGWRFV